MGDGAQSSAASQAASVPAGAYRRGLLLIALAAVLWSTGGLIVRSLDAADAWTTVFWRSVTAAGFLFLFLIGRDGLSAPFRFVRMGWPGVIVGVCYAVASTALIIALNLTSVADVLVIMSSAPFLAAVLGRIVLGERVRLWSWLAILVCMAGIAIMVSDSYGRGSLAGDLVALVIAFMQAIAVVTIRRHHNVQMTPAMGLATILAAAAVFPLARPMSVTVHDMILLTVFGAGQLGLGLALFSYGAALVPAAQASLLNVLEPVLGPLWVWLVLAERPSDAALLGGAIVLAALTFNTIMDLIFTRPRAEAVP